MTDDLANYDEYLRVMRLRAVVNLDVWPEPDESIDLILLLCAGGKG